MATRPGGSLGRAVGAGWGSEDVYFEETDTRFAIGWKGKYRIDGDAFVYIDQNSGRVVAILGYPVHRIAEWG